MSMNTSEKDPREGEPENGKLSGSGRKRVRVRRYDSIIPDHEEIMEVSKRQTVSEDSLEILNKQAVSEDSVEISNRQTVSEDVTDLPLSARSNISTDSSLDECLRDNLYCLQSDNMRKTETEAGSRSTRTETRSKYSCTCHDETASPEQVMAEEFSSGHSSAEEQTPPRPLSVPEGYAIPDAKEFTLPRPCSVPDLNNAMLDPEAEDLAPPRPHSVPDLDNIPPDARAARLDPHVYQSYAAGLLHSSSRCEDFVRLQGHYATWERMREVGGLLEAVEGHMKRYEDGTITVGHRT